MKDPQMHDGTHNSHAYSPHFKRSRNYSGDSFKRPHLPIDDVHIQVSEFLLENDVNIIIGETGCGKSTQIPQICTMIGMAAGGKMIAVSQPRRVAAISLAHRVAQEMNTDIGREVGYHVRFEQVKSDETKILYLTDGMLLRETLNDIYLDRYSVVIVDEAHERSLHTDVLFAVLRCVQRSRTSSNRRPLKIIIMSATLQADLFAEYFKAPIFVIKGRTFPVEIYYGNTIDPSTNDYAYQSVLAVKDLHRTEPIEDDILVFLTGREEIEAVCSKLKELSKELNHQKLFVVPLYAALSSAAQMKAFKAAPENHRKVIVSTNIAETSVTIPGIRIVIDSGKVKTKSFTASDRIDVLRVHSISQAQAVQRTGRAGREAPGKCFRLYPESHFKRMEKTMKPEILRCNLSTVILELVEMGLKRPDKVKWLEPPNDDAVQAAIWELQAHGAIETVSDGRFKLTELGDKMVRFPVSPAQARILIEAEKLKCLEDALWIVAVMCVESVYDAEERGKTEEVERARRKFESSEGDHISALLIMRRCNAERRKNGEKGLKEWCSANYVSYKNVLNAINIRTQLKDIAKQLHMDLLSCGANFAQLREALAIGLFMNACEYVRQDDRSKLVVQPAVSLKIHPTSQFSRSRPSNFIFSELVRTTDLYARDVTIIDPDWIKGHVQTYAKMRRIRDTQ